MFKTITACLNPKHVAKESDIKKIAPFIFLRWLAGSPYTIQVANQFNIYDRIPMENQYSLIQNVFGGKIKFIPYPKNTKNDSKELEVIAKHFRINLEIAKEYCEILGKEGTQEIIEMYMRG